MGAPEISDLYVSGTTNVANNMALKSGYNDSAGNEGSTPTLELSLLKTNVAPANVCDQSATINCTISLSANATGTLWGTSERSPLSPEDFECVVGNDTLDIDVAGKPATTKPSKTSLQILPKNQDPDLSSNTHICMQGTATVKVKLRNIYGKSSATKTLTININNNCPTEQKFNADTEAEPQGAFGEAVSISGTRAAVLTSGLNAYGLANVGGIRIYEKSGELWQYTTTVVPPSAELEVDKKPISVFLSGNNLFLGNSAINNKAGRLWFFQRDSSGHWIKMQTLEGPANSGFGTSLFFDGSNLFVGAPSGNGKIQIFNLSGTTLTLTSTLTGPDPNSDFGASLAVVGTRLLVGAPGSATNTNTSGNFFICDIATISTPNCTKWSLPNSKLGGETIPASSRLGSNVALSGTRALVAAKEWYPSSETTAPAIRHGLVALIDLSNNSVKILKGDNQERYGSALAFGDSSFFIGAKDALGSRGFVDQFSLTATGVTVAPRFRFYGVDQAPLDRFGSSIGFTGDTLAVGAPLDQEAGYSTAGSITFFKVVNP